MAGPTLKIYDGEKQVVDAVYCRNKETGELGWYDHVSEKFHPTPPPKINEAGLQWIDTGVQYIDTGYIPASLRPKGEWAKRTGVRGEVYCSECRTLQTIYDSSFKSRYCPNCGADMRGNPHDS